MRITEEGLRGLYRALRSTPPFRSWGLPSPNVVKFGVTHSKTVFGYYQHQDCGTRVIRLSSRLNKDFNTMAATMAHEMCHLRLDIAGLRTIPSEEHGEQFVRLARQVCRYHRSFDLGSF